MYIFSIQCPKTVVSNSSIVTFLLGGRYEISYARMTVKNHRYDVYVTPWRMFMCMIRQSINTNYLFSTPFLKTSWINDYSSHGPKNFVKSIIYSDRCLTKIICWGPSHILVVALLKGTFVGGIPVVGGISALAFFYYDR